MCKNCGGGMCVCAMIGKILLIIGGLNWGIMGVYMLLGKDSLNVVHMVLSSWPMVEAIVYVLVGLAAVMKIFGCRCKKCMTSCATCQPAQNMENKM